MLHWSNVSLRRYRDGLYLVKDAELIQAVPEIAWVNPQEPLAWAGQIWLPPILPSEHPLWQQAWRIAPRRGGGALATCWPLPSCITKTLVPRAGNSTMAAPSALVPMGG